MSQVEIVQSFLAGTAQATLTTQFNLEEDRQSERMLGTYAAVPDLDWAVIAQKRVKDMIE
jgi:hypothetical protein